MKKIKLLILLLIIGLLTIYFILRIQITNDANSDSDAFFAGVSSTNHEFIKNQLNFIEQNINDALAIIEKHKETIANFDYKNTKPSLNLMLDKASIEVSWHLTVLFKKKNNAWHIFKLNEYVENNS